MLELLVHLNGVLSAPLVLCRYSVPDGPGLILRLVVPSVVVPQASNLLLNPQHPAMEQVRLVDQTPFRLDQRLG